MSQYIIYEDSGRVRGFIDAIGMPPVIDGLNVHLMNKRVDSYPEAPTPTCNLHWNGGLTWIEGADIDSQRAHKVAEMSQACADAIFAGFTSSALGAAYHYPANEKDQANLTGSVMRSFYPTVTASWVTPFWCADANGNWQFRPHTAVQIQQVGDDAITAKLSCLGRNEMLAQQIGAANTSEEIAAIVWQA